MDNKRKIVGTVLGKGPAKLRKISLNAFEASEPLQETQTTEKLKNDSEVVTASVHPASTAMVDPEQEEVILKTALWISNNMDKAASLVEKSKENPMLAFLADTHGATTAGRMYLRELQRLKTEKEVQAVCSGTQDAPVVHASQIASFIEQSRLAAIAAAATLNLNTSGGLVAPAQAPVAAVPKERRNRWGPSVSETPSAPSSSSTTSRFGSIPTHYTTSVTSTSTTGRTSEEAHIAHLAASFDQPTHSSEDSLRLERQLREQREMQLIESRIRDAASQGVGSGMGGGDNKSIVEVAKFLAQHANTNTSTTSSSSSGHNNTNTIASAYTHKGPALLMAEKQAALYLERLAQYTELAALHDADTTYRDTTEEAERRGGVIEGGTWEHRKRAKEMLFTAGKNLELTLLGSGKSHMADYLPKDVLDAFLKNAESVSKGSGPSGSSVDAHALDSGNVGYQLLQKSGWAEGSGLGASGSGIVQPITSAHAATATAPVVVNGVTIAGGRGPEGSGVGTSATHEVAENDDDFDQYRKRMMLAYRFRPNPLNNPRRNYY